jgi:hypothetical protein
LAKESFSDLVEIIHRTTLELRISDVFQSSTENHGGSLLPLQRSLCESRTLRSFNVYTICFFRDYSALV